MPRGYYVRKPRITATCLVADCEKRQESKGYCNTHYHRWRRHGDPLGGRGTPGTQLPWLQSQVATRDRSEGCWEWPFSFGSFGYGACCFEGRTRTAHSVALILDGRPPLEPPNNHALHSCDNPPCFNPAHLRWGSQAENARDMVKRQRHARGEMQAAAKLTEADVRAIRKDGRYQRVIAEEYGIAQTGVSAIKRGVSWSHVLEESID